MSPIKEALKSISESLPDTATWDDAMYELMLRRKLERALDDADNGRVYSSEQVRQMFLKK